MNLLEMSLFRMTHEKAGSDIETDFCLFTHKSTAIPLV